MKPTKFLKAQDLPRLAEEKHAVMVAASAARPTETPKVVAAAHLAALDVALKLDLDLAQALILRLPPLVPPPPAPTLHDLVLSARAKLQSMRTNARVPRIEAARRDLDVVKKRTEQP
ncbi:hypothetical protein [Sorangium sp. So ce341]|uniref:hypothetical protein n=1 Tax=Sorangium sp. So ce341 TaxID=3133302 RepID=UPI003F63BB53